MVITLIANPHLADGLRPAGYDALRFTSMQELAAAGQGFTPVSRQVVKKRLSSYPVESWAVEFPVSQRRTIGCTRKLAERWLIRAIDRKSDNVILGPVRSEHVELTDRPRVAAYVQTCAQVLPEHRKLVASALSGKRPELLTLMFNGPSAQWSIVIQDIDPAEPAGMLAPGATSDTRS